MRVNVETQGAGMPPFHPLADIFPLMNGMEFEQLKASVTESGGPREPIVIYEGKILDGRNRARACEAVGIQPQYIRLPCDADPVTFVIDKNLRRRHLNESQRAMAAARLATMAQGARTDLSPIGEKSQAEVAQLLNVGKRSVERAAKVQNNGILELQQAVDRGEIAVSAAEEIARLPRDQQIATLPNGNRAIMASRQQPPGSLDFSPTPPKGTRALIERVFPALGILRASLTTVCEPACGHGHMAEVLREYFRTVEASDIHAYGYGGVRDFLAPDCQVDADWIITNPPFKDKAEQFALRALDQARVGVAIFAQLRWLETIGRYERLFRDQPPTLIAFFCERIALHMDKWDPKGRTATAYIWLVWLKGRHPRAPFWIPPDPEKTLCRPDDVERFTKCPVDKKQHLPAHDPETGEVIEAAAPELDGTKLTESPDDLSLPTFLRRDHSDCSWR